MTKQQQQVEASQLAYGECTKCGAPLTLKHVGKSSFLGCTTYPKCDFTQALNTNEVTTIKLIENSVCPTCEGELAVKKGRYGMFIGCTQFPSCDYISSKQEPSAEKQADVCCPQCKQGRLKKRQNRFGKHFYACNNYPKCKYVVNLRPIENTCPKCDWPILLVKDNKLTCAQGECDYETKYLNDNES